MSFVRPRPISKKWFAEKPNSSLGTLFQNFSVTTKMSDDK